MKPKRTGIGKGCVKKREINRCIEKYSKFLLSLELSSFVTTHVRRDTITTTSGEDRDERESIGERMRGTGRKREIGAV